MAFDPPLRSEFREVVLRSLRDIPGNVFNADVVNDFINEGLSDMSSYRPIERIERVAWPLPEDPVPFTEFTDIWAVTLEQLVVATGYVITTYLPYASQQSGEGRGGWDFYAGVFRLDPMWASRLNMRADQTSVELVVYGYADRTLPLADDEVLDLRDTTDYQCLVAHCKHLGFELLNHDRALYQQWLAATNNTDVSPTQLQGMATLAETTFTKTRSRSTKLRRRPVSDYVYSH